jgi:hypothetical protein
MSRLNAKEFMLAELRCAAARMRLVTFELEAVAVALKDGFISPEMAVLKLKEADLMWACSESLQNVLMDGTNHAKDKSNGSVNRGQAVDRAGGSRPAAVV